MIGHAAHGGLFFSGLAPIPGGEGQIQLPGSQLGILVEHLVEVAQTEKQDAVLIVLLDGVVLPLHGGQFINSFGHKLGSFSIKSGVISDKLPQNTRRRIPYPQ